MGVPEETFRANAQSR